MAEVFDDSSQNPLVDQRSDISDKSNYDFMQNPVDNAGGVVDKGTSSSGWASGTFLDGSFNIAEGIQKGDWVAVGIGGAGVALDAVSAGTDPIGFVAGQLFGWMLEHLEPLRAALHALAGNPDMVKGYAASWTNIEEKMKSVAEEYQHAAPGETSQWTSKAGQAYRTEAKDLADLCTAASKSAGGVASAASTMAEVVNTIRSLVRDLLAGLAGALVSYALELAGTLGAAAPVVIEQALVRIATTGGKIASFLAKLAKTVSALGDLLTALKNILEGANKAAQAHQEGK